MLSQILKSNKKCICFGTTAATNQGARHWTSEHTFKRPELVAAIIDRMHQMHVVLVRSPPKTGKTTAAVLVREALVERYEKKARKSKSVTFSFSMADFSEEAKFEDTFEQMFKLGWGDTDFAIPCDGGRAVYLIVDDAERLCKRSSASSFWCSVKGLLPPVEPTTVRILMFASHDIKMPDANYSQPVAMQQYQWFLRPVEIKDPDARFGTDELCFSSVRVAEFITKRLKCIACFENVEVHGVPALSVFCRNLECLTGGRIDQCEAAIRSIDRVYRRSCLRSSAEVTKPVGGRWWWSRYTAVPYRRLCRHQRVLASRYRTRVCTSCWRDARMKTHLSTTVSQILNKPCLTAQELICKLQDGLVFRDLTTRSSTSEAINTLRTLSDANFVVLERMMHRRCGWSEIEQARRHAWVTLGVLEPSTSSRCCPTFPSPVMGRLFLQRWLSLVPRNEWCPTSVDDLIFRALLAFNYASLRGREIGWRMAALNVSIAHVMRIEFCKVLRQCTSSQVAISANGGSFYGLPGDHFLDVTVRSVEKEAPSAFFWGIALLEQDYKLDEHIDKFADASRGNSELTDFRRMAETTERAIQNDLDRNGKLFIVCYDGRLEDVVVYNLHRTARTIKVGCYRNR